MHIPRTRHNLRCSCRNEPILATYGVDSKGLVYVHVRIWKQDRVFGEIISHHPIELMCRDCRRWHKVNIMQPDERAELIRTNAPEIGPRGRFD